jgi:hypothetical protein
MLDKMKQFHKTFTERSENVFPMFSTEIAPSELAGISNPYNKQPTITGTNNTGTINAFSLWEWDDFNDFLNKIISEYKVGGVAIFQMNMISKDW